jgi:hypothetical protein
LSVDELHGVEMDALLATDRVDGHDVWVPKRCRRSCLGLEALQLARVQRGGERQHLQRHTPGQRELLRFVDNPHAAVCHLAQQAEVAQLTRHRGGGWFRASAAAEVSSLLFDQSQPGKADAKATGDGGVLGEQAFGIDGTAGLDVGEAAVEHVGQLHFGAAPGVFARRGGQPAVAHGTTPIS